MNELNVIEEKFTRCPQCRSFSVKQTDERTPLERIKGNFVSITAFKCNNCSYRFVEYGEFSFSSGKNWLLIAVPALLIVSLSLFFFLQPPDQPHPNGKKPVVKPIIKKTKDSDKPKKTGKTGNTTVINTDNKNTSKVPTTTEPPKIEIFNEIVLGNSNRFGVNWRGVKKGAQIFRLSNGPLKDAGLKVGDIFSEVDGEKIDTGDKLTAIRDAIFAGTKAEAIIKVFRNNDVFYFKLVKNRREKKNEKIDQSPTPLPQDPPSSLQSSTPTGLSSTKICAAGKIKQRKSAPGTTNNANLWSFFKQSLTIERNSAQRVFISGDPTGSGKWGVDDQLVINGTPFPGLTSVYSQTSGNIPEKSLCPPLDITALVPAGKKINLSIVLADHGKYWANTDIYIVVK